jgi:inhibitor of cysteine peptidase
MIAMLSIPALALLRLITEADNGSELHVKTGSHLELRLPSNPTTGYKWYVQAESTSLLTVVDQGMRDVGKLPGSGGVQVFRLRATHAGEGVLRLHYVRRWEQPAKNEKQFTIHVVIE